MTTLNKNKCVALIVLLSLTACNSDESTPIETITSPGSAFSQESVSQSAEFSVGIHTLDANGNDTVEFAQGQQIYYSITITNLTSDDQILTYPDPSYPAYCIRRAGSNSCLWDSQFDMGAAAVTVPNEYSSFEAQVFGGMVEQVGNDGMAFGPGEYEIRSVTGRDSALLLLGSPWHSFTITD